MKKNSLHLKYCSLVLLGGLIFSNASMLKAEEEVVADSAKLPLEKVLPANIKVATVYSQFQNDKYGFVVLKNGIIPVIYNKDGQALLQVQGWSSQGMQKKEGEKPTFKSFGVQGSSKNIVINDEKDEVGNTTITVSGTSSFFDWKEVIVMKESQIDITYTYTVTKDAPAEWTPNISMIIKNLAPGLTGAFAKPNANPVQVVTDLGLMEITFSKDWRSWFKGYSARNGVLNVAAFNEARVEGAIAEVSFTITLP